MPDFEGANIVELQPLDEKVPVQFKVTVCTAASTNDGFLPFGYTVQGTSASTAVTAKKYPSSTSATTDLIDGSITVSSSIITVPLTWPASSSGNLSAGTYHLTFKLRLSGATVRYREANFNRVFARDK